ncbi:MAG: chorismate synthase [Alistipes sp.]|nr:chorismate synthase [Candidatus Alistipes equi]
MNNSFGHNIRLTIWGASHAEKLGVDIEGVPQGISLTEMDFLPDLERRRSGKLGTTPRHEKDLPFVSEGVDSSITTGGKIRIEFRNENVRSGDYSLFENQPRPSHVDLVARRKYGPDFDLRGSGIFSGRMTLGLVAAGVVAKKLLRGITFRTSITEIAGQKDESRFEELIRDAAFRGDSLGAVIECRAEGVPCSLGEPYFDSAESVISHLLFSIPGIKGVEFGSGFEGVRLPGSKRNDPIIDAHGHTLTNNEGGINGGITNGNPLVVRVAVKPAASISIEQNTFSFSSSKMETLRIPGRHDSLIALRAMVVVEAMIAFALADLSLYDR